MQFFRNFKWAVKRVVAKKPTSMTGKPILIGGFAAPGFEKVLDTFRNNLKSGLERGGSFAAYYKGDLVVNVWGGHCDYDCRRPWKEDTMSTFFSSTKAVSAFVIAHMVDRGVLDYKEKVSKYWPAFSQNGKENITLEQLISNQAGLITLDKPFWLAEMRDDPKGLSAKLAEQKPYWNPGEKHGYHPLTFGLYLDQVVRHADKKGRSLAHYFQEEIAQPFDIEYHIGLPKSLNHRAARVVLNQKFENGEQYRKEHLKYFEGDIEMYNKTNKYPALDFKSTLKVNDPDMRELPVPSTHGHGTAANMAKLFGIVGNGGVHKGQRLLSEKAIQRFTEPLVAGYDVSFGMNAAWSLGTHLITMVAGDQPPNQIFGHGGYGGQYAASDIKHKVGFAYTTCFLDPFSSYHGDGDRRMTTLFDALYDCVYTIENIKVPRVTFHYYSQFKNYLDQRTHQSKL